MNNGAERCLITDIAKPNTIALARMIGTAFFSFLPTIITIGRAMRKETMGPTKTYDTFNCGSVVLKMMNVATTY